MWYWKAVKYNLFILINQRTGKQKEFSDYSLLYDYCQVHCINAKQV